MQSQNTQRTWLNSINTPCNEEVNVLHQTRSQVLGVPNHHSAVVIAEVSPAAGNTSYTQRHKRYEAHQEMEKADGPLLDSTQVRRERVRGGRYDSVDHRDNHPPASEPSVPSETVLTKLYSINSLEYPLNCVRPHRSVHDGLCRAKIAIEKSSDPEGSFVFRPGFT